MVVQLKLIWLPEYAEETTERLSANRAVDHTNPSQKTSLERDIPLTMNIVPLELNSPPKDKVSALPYPDEGGLFSSETLYPRPLPCSTEAHLQYTPRSCSPPASYPQYLPQECSMPMPSHSQYSPRLSHALKASNPPKPTKADRTQKPSRTLEVQFANWTLTHISVAEVGAEDSALYTTDLNIRKPHLTFQSVSTESTLATVNFCYSSPDIRVCIDGRIITLRVGSGSDFETTYKSPALWNTCLSWKNRSTSKGFDLECLDEDSVPLAAFTADSTFNKTRACRLELFGDRVTSGVAMDEVVVIGLALAHYALTEVKADDTI
ncbi:hypothetical protein FQN54_001999 [Arachnomyces sp. PD_36]|nr:hypothetical protein FQN54_001999 [Arachnomyces sp. PD_36]